MGPSGAIPAVFCCARLSQSIRNPSKIEPTRRDSIRIRPKMFAMVLRHSICTAAAAAFLGLWSFAAPAPAASAGDSESASFGLCHSGGGTNCVVDGDTIYYRGAKIRIADIDTPETHGPRCPLEAELGAAATRRMHQLVNAGPFTLQSINRDTDRYGRKLRILTRGGESLGAVLVREGLARFYAGGRRPWC